MPENWRETLFVWDGILSFVEQGTSSEETKDLVEDIIKWEGTWVGVDSADATKVETPKRDAFQEFVTSDNKFEVSGAAVKGEDVGTDDDVTGRRSVTTASGPWPSNVCSCTPRSTGMYISPSVLVSIPTARVCILLKLAT